MNCQSYIELESYCNSLFVAITTLPVELVSRHEPYTFVHFMSQAAGEHIHLQSLRRLHFQDLTGCSNRRLHLRRRRAANGSALPVLICPLQETLHRDKNPTGG